MTAGGIERARDTAAVNVDEVGIHYGVLGDLRFDTLYEPVFAVHRGVMMPVAVCASTATHRAGKQLATQDVVAKLSPNDRDALAAVCRRLHLSNLDLAAETPLDLHLMPAATGSDFQSALAGIENLVADAREIGIAPSRIVVDLSHSAERGQAFFAACASVLRGARFRVALDTSVMHILEDGDHGEPDLVRLPSPWLHSIARDASALRLVSAMVTGLRARDIAVQAEGIDSIARLRMAVEADVDLLQGALLADSALAGCIFDEEPRAIAALLDSPVRLVPLFGA